MVERRPAACVTLADALLTANPVRYVQLVGNHEAHYLGGPSVAGRSGVREVTQATQATLRRWWDTGLMRVAYALRDTMEFGPVLITHGGLTAGFHRELGSPSTVKIAADRLNAAAGNPDFIFRPGALMTGLIDHAAGPLCPRTGAELAASWLKDGSMPFSQVHGHERIWYWPQAKFHDDAPADVRTITRKDERRRFCWATVHGKVLYSVDPVLGLRVPGGYEGAALTLHGR